MEEKEILGEGYGFDPSLVLYLPLWKLDATSGGKITSQDAYGYLCTVTGAVWRPTGRYFDGADDEITMGDTSTFAWLHGAADTTSFQSTISLWISLPTPEPDALYALVSTNLAALGSRGFMIFFDDRSAGPYSRRLRYQMSNGTASVIDFASNDNAYPNDSDFHLLTFTYDQALADTNATIYVDATLKKVGNKAAVTPSASASVYALHIGMAGDGSFDAAATIGEIWVYNRVLTSLEIQHNYLTTKWRYV